MVIKDVKGTDRKTCVIPTADRNKYTGVTSITESAHNWQPTDAIGS